MIGRPKRAGAERRWFSVLDENHADMVERQPMVLHRGLNSLKIHWKKNKGGVPLLAALYMNVDDSEPKDTSPFLAAKNEILSQSSITLNWDVTLATRAAEVTALPK